MEHALDTLWTALRDKRLPPEHIHTRLHGDDDLKHAVHTAVLYTYTYQITCHSFLLKIKKEVGLRG